MSDVKVLNLPEHDLMRIYEGVSSMSNMIKVSASAVSHVGMVKASNEDSFYINGRFMHEYETDSIQVSIENSGSEYLFAVSDSMDRMIPEKGIPLSIARELKRFQEKIKGSTKGIQVKFELLSECINEASNLVHSMELGNGISRENEPSFAGLLLCENKAAVLCTGTARIYMIRNGSIRQFPSDSRKAERLLKMGIITDEQAEMLSNRYGIAAEQSKKEVSRMEISDLENGDLILLCTDGLTNMVEDDRIYEILMEDSDTGEMAGMLVKEALKNGGEDNITAIAVRVGEPDAGITPRAFGKRYRLKEADMDENEEHIIRKPRSRVKTSRMIRRIISTTIAFIIVAGAFYGLYRLWMSIGSNSETDGLDKPETEMTDGQDIEETPDETDIQDNETDESGVQSGSEDTPVESTQPVKEEIPESGWYTVKKGDTLYSISKRFYGDPQKYKLIMEANGIENPNLIKVGQKLLIPNPSDPRP